jgi:hypothetical protein
MKRARLCFLAALIPLGLVHCYLARAYTYEINTGTGRFTAIYHDIRSDGQTDSAIAADWQNLREAVSSDEPDVDTAIFRYDTTLLFVEDSVLSARQEFRVRCPRCFPSSAALLETLLEGHSGFSVQRINKDVLLVADTGIELRAANGSVARTEHGTYVFWSEEDTLLSLTWSQPEQDTGISLLPYYRKSARAKKSR